MSTLHPETDEARRQFEEEVFPAELAYVEDRRRSVGDERGLAGATRISTDNDLVGLALSGGGIRSASFSLGFLQSLGSRLFRRVDYLSTVSGGGFIGSAITALMANAFYRKPPGSGPAEFPFPLTREEEEPESISHLRNNSDYMKPGGVGDVFLLLAVLMRGILLNSLALFPFLLLVCLLVLLVYGQQLSDRARFDDQVKSVDGLLARYYGDRLQTERELDPLLAALEEQALLRIDQGRTRGDVVNQLRSTLSLDLDAENGRDLITGTGTDEVPYRLAPSASRRDLARALLEGDVLQRYEVIEEIDLLARVLAKDGYQHCRAAEGGEQEDSDEKECEFESHAMPFVEAMQKRSLLRTGFDAEVLGDLLTTRWSASLKPILQALYNGEYLDEGVVRTLTEDELGRSAYYAYGWYEARVGDPFYASWYVGGTDREPPFRAVGESAAPIHEDLLETVVAEVGALVPRFRDECLAPDKALQDCARAGTTAEDLARLFVFEELSAADASLRSWAELRAWAHSLDPEPAKNAVEVLYFAEYLDEAWVLSALRDAATEPEAKALAERIEEFLEADLLGEPAMERFSDPLVLDRTIVCADLMDVLHAEGLAEGSDCSIRDLHDSEEGSESLEAIWNKLDEQWVARMLYVYHYGWHRSWIGKPYPGSWCVGAAAGRYAEGCPEVSDEAWSELARALRDPSRWDADRFWLPLTWVVVQTALGWVLLAPLFLLVVRPIYRRRQRVVAQARNPLAALLSSDQSLSWRLLYERSFALLLIAIFLTALFEFLPYFVHHFHYLELEGQSSRTFAIGAVSLLATALSGPAIAFLGRVGRTLALALLAVAGPVLLITFFVQVMEYVVYSPPTRLDAVLGLFGEGRSGAPGSTWTLWFTEGGRRLLDPAAAWLLFLLTALASFAVARLIDINSTSLHGLYRDRLSRAFMIGLDTEGDIEPEEDLALHQICPAGSGAPYHLINVALNLQASPDRSLRGRSCDFLFFSRDHVGGPRTGYCRSRDLAWVFPQAHLATAAAVSGAAVSPNMGRYRTGPLAVLLSLLNARLALWMPHPAAVRAWFAGRGDGSGASPGWLRDAWRRFRLGTPATLLLRELVGAIHEGGLVVNVSDGGHIENTGALELLRRRCREIILVDGEGDPDMSFAGLAQLQRTARIDMGIEIEIDLEPLRPDEKGLSRRRSAVGLIRYPAVRGRDGRDLVAETGRLLYVKLAVTGTEGETVAEYRAQNAAFPHESTGDQAFDEAQLEAYRELGELAGREIFEAARPADERDAAAE